MSSMNGLLSPPPIIDTVTSSMNLSSKRKREDSVPDSDCAALPEMPLAESQALVKDLIEILKADDPTPSILTRSIPETHQLNRLSSKRPKAEENGESRTSILGRLSSNSYVNVDEVLDDIDAVVKEISGKIDPSITVVQNQNTTDYHALSELSTKIVAFSKRAHDLARKGKASWKMCHTINSNPTHYDCVRFSGQDGNSNSNSNSQSNGVVLTLYGSAPTPKQLFSSFQKPTKVNGCKEDVIIPIQEVDLPNGISTTRIITTYPHHTADSKKRPQTLGEIFPTPPNVTPFIPPKPSLIATTKSSTVGWYHPIMCKNTFTGLSYLNQGISSGQWIDYSKTRNFSQANRTKSRDRVLDPEVNKIASSETEFVDSDPEKLETLFRSAYSSFAPTKDNAAAIASTGCLDQLWWHATGEKYFNRLVQNSNKRMDMEATRISQENDSSNDLLTFETGLEEIEKNPTYLNFDEPQYGLDKAIHQKDIDEILEEISELLQTLASYQRIRNLSLNAPNRSSCIHPSPDLNSVGTPLKPNESELATYEILRSQLSLMVASLPPYAVAKINSDRLADLSISTKIEVQVHEYKGVMEEDESPAKPKKAGSINSTITSPRPSSQSIHRVNSGNSSSNSHYGNQFASPQTRGPSTQYYSSVQTPIRPPESVQRQPATISGPYQAQRTSSTGSYRQNTYGLSAFSHQTARSVQQPYNPSGQHMPYPQTSISQGYIRTPSQTYHHQHGPQSVAPTTKGGKITSQSAYQSQPQVQPTQSEIDYGQHGNCPIVPRQVSPQKSVLSPQNVLNQSQASQSAQLSSISQRTQIFGANSIGHQALTNGLTPGPSQSLLNQQTTALRSQGISHQSNSNTNHQQINTMAQRQQAISAIQQHKLQDSTKIIVEKPIIGSPKTSSNGSSLTPAGY